MTNIVASKIHYDHRKNLPLHLKYSRPPSKAEYDAILKLYYEEGIGGEGFHECLNFNKKNNEDVKIYLPPGYVPNEEICKDNILLFTFTYKEDKELPASIIGVHANVKVLSREIDGITRTNINLGEGITELFYHAVAPSEMTTLFSSPLAYDYKQGIYTPRYKSWGNGLRYLENDHAIKILTDSLEQAKKLYPKEKNKSKLQFIEEEISVISKILYKTFGIETEIDKPKFDGSTGQPDKEIGHLGEAYIYNRELEYAEKNDIDPINIEWLSQVVPSSVCDIKTVRKKDGVLKEHYLEVKSTKEDNFNNVYISSRQIEFFQSNPKDSTFVFVKFDASKNPIETKELNVNELKSNFDLKPIKFKICEKTNT